MALVALENDVSRWIMKKVIVVSSKANHGKDTFANIFKEYATQNGDKVLITHYADYLKMVCQA